MFQEKHLFVEHSRCFVGIGRRDHSNLMSCHLVLRRLDGTVVAHDHPMGDVPNDIVVCGPRAFALCWHFDVSLGFGNPTSVWELSPKSGYVSPVEISLPRNAGAPWAFLGATSESFVFQSERQVDAGFVVASYNLRTQIAAVICETEESLSGWPR